MSMHCSIVDYVITILTKVIFWIYSICSSKRGEALQQRNIFPNVLLSCFPNILTSSPDLYFHVSIQHCVVSIRNSIYIDRKYSSFENPSLSLEILDNETPKECLDESLTLRVRHLNVHVGRLSQYFMSVVTMFLGILENSSRGVMTTLSR